MSLPKFLEPFLPSRFDTKEMDLRDPGDKWDIIEQVLNRGDIELIKWLFKTYTVREIKRVIEKPTRGFWDRSSLDLWLKALNVKLPKIIYEVAIFSLDPRPKIAMRYFNYLKRKGKVPKRTLKIWEQFDKIEKMEKRRLKKEKAKK